MVLAFAVGFILAAQLAILIGAAYVLWRYCYIPWKVMRKDLAAMDVKVSQMIEKADSVLTKVKVFSDEELALQEKRLDARRRAHSL